MSSIAALIIVGPLIIWVVVTLGLTLSGRRRTKEIPSPARTEFDCAVYLYRIFDQRLIDAGIDTTLSKCNDPECFVCHPKSKEIPKSSVGVSSSGIASPIRSECHQCNVPVTLGMDTCHHCTRSLLEKRRLEREKAQRSLRYRRVGNRKIPIPPGTPAGAHLVVDYDPQYMCDRAVWRWTDTDTGQSVYRTQILSCAIDFDNVFAEEGWS